MRLLHNLPIKRKLTLLILLTSATALVLPFAASISYELSRFRSGIVHDLSTQAEITGANCAAALAFNDPRTARETLALLAARRGILSARVYRTDGSLFAEFVRGDAHVPDVPRDFLQAGGDRFEDREVLVCRRIFLGNEDVGGICLRADLHEQLVGLKAYALISLGVMLALFIVTMLLSNRLQRFISEPILSLTQVARAVSERKDYSLRAIRQSDDEIGRLADDFNQMLGEIEKHHVDLRASEERFRQLAENIRGVFWMIDLPRSRTLYVSPAYETIWGRPCSGLYQSPDDWLKAVHPEDVARVRAAITEKRNDGRFDEEFRIIRPDGVMRWIRDRGFPIQNEKGEVYRIAGVAEDITERKQAEAALAEKDQWLRAVVDRAPIVVFAIGKDGLITMEEGHALHQINIKPGQNVGRHMADMFMAYPKVVENMTRSLAGEEFTDVVEFGGQVFSTWHAPQRDPRGNITGMVGVATNVTERFQLEREVLEISDREQARIGQDLHDGLCQYLVGIAFAANALEEKLAAQGAPDVAAVHEIAALLDEAITQARNTAYGLYPARLEEEGLAYAFGELTAHVSARYDLDCKLDYPEPVLLVDNARTIQLYRIAQEAISNIVKHAQAHQIVIRLTKDGGQIILSVVDDGIGITEPAQRHRGMGLNIMEYRARTIGGTLTVRRCGVGGTEVRCSVAEKPTGPGRPPDGQKS